MFRWLQWGSYTSFPLVSPFSIHSTVTLSLSSFKDVTMASCIRPKRQTNILSFPLKISSLLHLQVTYRVLCFTNVFILTLLNCIDTSTFSPPPLYLFPKYENVLCKMSEETVQKVDLKSTNHSSQDTHGDLESMSFYSNISVGSN